MPRFLVKRDFAITGQYGDDFDVVITVPMLFPLNPEDTITFEVFEAMSTTIRLTKDDEIVRLGQQLTIPFSDTDTAALRGSFRWKLRVIRAGIKTRIGQGTFNLK